MKKLLYLAIALFFNVLSAQVGPKIEFKDKENTIDYGTTSKDIDDGVRKFVFTNTGDAPLIISNAKSTCGCTVPDFPKEPIMPGNSSFITVKYNMNPGPIRKTITIESNAVNVEGGMVALKIKGEVIIKKETSPLEKKQGMLEKP
ncbi:DUF1573 domain-containing protein [Flavobacterium aciduliphilum]|uniref:Uncharacterized protein DUF1573 n=1 Tax=Flavobacterium aciduliphilum TaxID=1101402 RepID=A0A328YAF3_9FLAO|nr:DUF1573 domain-containing protein [Flavobacterium aciduliphilum]RAR70153.1 uncharacterized protein DUF1573 [Flavobacterium aciduliphilum]